MSSAAPTNSRSIATVDQNARGLSDPSGNLIGVPMPSRADRTVWALPMTQSGTQRYLPNHSASEVCNFWLDFSLVIPFGVGIAAGGLSIFTNVAVPAAADSDWTVGPVAVFGRAIYAQLARGNQNTDYQFRWFAEDTMGNQWVRTALCLCAETS